MFQKQENQKQKHNQTPKMLIKVKTLTGKEIEINIEADDQVRRIKEKVEETAKR